MKRLLLIYVLVLPFFQPTLGTLGAGKTVVAADVIFVALAMAVAIDRRHLLPLRADLVGLALLPPLALVVSGLSAGGVEDALPDLFRVGYSMCVLLLLSHLRLGRAETVAVAWAWLAAGIVVSVVGLAAFLGVAAPGLAPTGVTATISRDLGVYVARLSAMMNPNALILYLQTALTFTCLLAVQGAGRWHRIAPPAAVFLLVVAVLTFSRGIAGLLVGLALVAANAREVPQLWRMRRVLLVAALVFTAATAARTVWAVVPLRWIEGADGAGHLALDERPNFYFVLHKAAVRMFFARPLVGQGPGSFGRNVAVFTSVEEREGAWPLVSLREDWDPHSTWLGWAAETGLLGLLAWGALYGWVLRRLLSGPAGLDLPRLAGLMGVGVLVNGFHVEISHLKFLWAFFGIALASRLSPDLSRTSHVPD